ncbi:S8 family serine peptidase [Chryseobacterium sp. MFBS3-17]|uniref:S8 family serine peptidase n=1 Tax=Chryseobacterium sp. MFBS3-17 TaxID=2886689 RepID=UPI001D0E75A3|nr:S8 family serine peptidase [Chryseobacterium sp. MFBS3-17]MCC2590754.1 S8 family serine peptidase [Chryseobacterium sp. MFBS3-17]
MKKILIAALFMTGFAAFAQADQSVLDPMQDKDLMTWYHKDFATTGVHGVNTENAYKFLESKGLKPKTVIVGVLDSGVEVDHPGLIANMWKNPNEVPGNGKDDDGNGYVDDVHGWNFMGGKAGDINDDNLEVTRVVKKYQSVFEGPDSAKNKENQAKMKEEFDMYVQSKKIFEEKGSKAKQNYQMYSKLNEMIPTMVALLKGNNLTQEAVSAIKPSTPDEMMSVQVLSGLVADPELTGKTPAEVQAGLQGQMKEALDYFESQATKHYNLDFDPRAIVGDNYEDYSEKFYGNNNYEGADAMHGTHVAGIIAGLPHGNEVQYGVASRVAKIMNVRTVPNGDERDKDVANSIRYAVDNGAKVLNMSFGKPVSPGKNVVWDAFKYAEDKGVLLVKAAGNDNQNLGTYLHYPTNFKKVEDEKPFVNNVLTVGASTKDAEKLRAGFSNYNEKLVDVFAPGTQIYSTVPDYKYEYSQGTSMASPVVAGAAAVLFAYMPNLKPHEVIESLVKSVNPSQVATTVTGGAGTTFDQLSRSGGVIDLRKAAEYAYNNFYKADTGARKTPAKKATRKAAKSK